MDFIFKLLIDDDAATLAEYAILLGFIMVVVVTVISAFGTRINSSRNKKSS